MRRLCLLLLIGLASTGCTSSGSRTPDARPASRDRDRDNPGPANAPFWADPNARSAPPPEKTTGRNNNRIPPAGLPTRGESEGLIAGAVVDSDGQRVPNAFIQISSLNGSKTAKPIGVHTDGQGYFSIPVRSAQSYELNVSVRDQDRTLAASMVVQAPDTQVILRVNEGNVSSLTPKVPPPPSTGPFNSSTPPRDPRSPAASTWRDAPPPVQSGTPRGPLPPITSSNPENIAVEPNFASLPAANIPGPNSLATAPLPPSPPPGAASGLQPSTFRTAPRPTKLDFELTDLQGKSWRFGDHNGKLVLLDFWGTWCAPCMKAVPHIKQLAKEYGTSGLEVIGVACERDGTWNQQANNVARVAQRNEMNYGLYLEPEGKTGSVQDKFAVKSYPTLILLDRDGKVLYRGTDFVQLERIIKNSIR